VSFATRRKLLFFFILFTAALTLLAVALPLLEFQPGEPVPRVQNGQVRIGVSGEGQASNYKINNLFFTLLMSMVAIVAVGAIFNAIRGTPWNELVKRLIRSLVICLGLVGFLMLASLMIPSGEVMELEQEMTPIPMVIETVPLGSPPPVLTWIVGILLVVGVALVAVWVVRARPAPNQTLLHLEQEAEKARQALLAGMSLREVILQCYRQMSNVLQKDHGIERQAYMTTGDFERLLAEEGFPEAPVQQLTRLFNAVRYGRWQPGLEDEREALACLEAIIQFSRQTQKRSSR